MALKGQREKQLPQKMHLEKSMRVCPFSSLWMALVGQESSQGTVVLTMAWNGQTEMHLPHFTHLS